MPSSVTINVIPPLTATITSSATTISSGGTPTITWSSTRITGTPFCIWCKKTKEWFKDHKVKYEEHDVSVDDKAREEMIKKSSQMGVPVLEINGKIIVGFDRQEIEKALKKK